MSTIPGKAPAVKIPPQVETARDLLLEELGKLLTIEETLARRMLPLIVGEVEDEELKPVVSQHLEETRNHAARVKEAFGALEETPAGKRAIGLEGLATEHASFVPEVVPGLRAGVHCEAAMGTEHYEINAYDGAIRLADALGATDVGELLRANLAEEVAALQKLAAQADRLAKLAVEDRSSR
jgi:ferritin-like metal-binding protein YciE